MKGGKIAAAAARTTTYIIDDFTQKAIIVQSTLITTFFILLAIFIFLCIRACQEERAYNLEEIDALHQLDYLIHLLDELEQNLKVDKDKLSFDKQVIHLYRYIELHKEFVNQLDRFHDWLNEADQEMKDGNNKSKSKPGRDFVNLWNQQLRDWGWID